MVVEYIQANPKLSIIIIATIISLLISVINFFVLDKEKMRASRKRQKEIQKELKASKDDPTKTQELSTELMKHSLESMKHSFKPLIFTLLPILVIFGWIREVFSETSLAGSWFWWYIVTALVSGMIFRKLFKLP